MYITSFEQLSDFCQRAKKQHVLAVDTEFMRENNYYPKLCLIQLGIEGETCAIDPFAIDDFSPLVDLFEDPDITKVFHACTQDLEVISYALKCNVSPVFDTQVAASFLGYRMQLGYASLVSAYTGVRLPKAESLTDWSRRPLDAEQLCYAEDDVEYLPGIYQQQMHDLVEKNRLAWVMPEMQQISDPRKYQVNPREVFRRLRRSSTFSRKQLSIAREVCKWRELAAQKHNIPRKWVLSDEVIVELCKRPTDNFDRLMRIRGVEKLSSASAHTLLDAIARGVNADPETYPEAIRIPHITPETQSVVDLMYSVLRLVSDENGIAAQVLATRDDLVGFLEDKRSSKLCCGWRYELIGHKLEDLLAGRIGLTVKDGKVEIL